MTNSTSGRGDPGPRTRAASEGTPGLGGAPGAGPNGCREPGWAGRALTALLAALLALAWMAGTAGAYEHRRSTPSIGGQLQAGILGTDSEWGELFDWGRGGTVRLRQYVARNRAIGISFELQKFRRDSGKPRADESFNEDYFQAQLLMLDYYFYFRRPQKQCPYAVISGGFYRPEIVDEEKLTGGGSAVQVEHPGEGLLARLGVGLEYFVARTFSFDASLSGYYFNASSQDGLTASVQLALGVHIYTGR